MMAVVVLILQGLNGEGKTKGKGCTWLTQVHLTNGG